MEEYNQSPELSQLPEDNGPKVLRYDPYTLRPLESEWVRDVTRQGGPKVEYGRFVRQREKNKGTKTKKDSKKST